MSKMLFKLSFFTLIVDIRVDMSMIVSVMICLAPFPQLLKMLTLRYTGGMDAVNDSGDLHHNCTCI